VAKKKRPLSTVVAFMSDDAQAQIEGTRPQGSVTLPLTSILPDPGQPRRLLPADLAEGIFKGELSLTEAVQRWVSRAEVETANEALRHNIHELKRLADSIKQHGLISPISVREPRTGEMSPAGTEYLIVTGERRFWAQVYLTSLGEQIHEGNTLVDPAHIKATIAPPGVTVRAHQLIENLLREDINAVEKARGMWALRYELSGMDYPTSEVNHGSPEAEAGGVNRDSPLASSEGLVPWTRVEETLGISKRYRIFTTSVLNLSPEALNIVQNHNLAERTIRPIVQKLKEKPGLQVRALKQLVDWQAEDEESEGASRSIVGAVKALVDQLLTEESQSEDAQPKSTRAVSSAPVIRFRSKIRQTLDFLNRLKPADRAGLTQALEEEDFADVMVDLRNLRQQIDAILATASKKVDEQMSPPSTEKSEGD
jgi:hypothetical protein